MARVIFLDPYHGPSHAALSLALRNHSRHDVTLLTLPPRKWKWRMRGSAWHFAERAAAEPEAAPDVVLASDFLNLPDWKAMAPRTFRRAPAILYFHENQVTYPLTRPAGRPASFASPSTNRANSRGLTPV